MTSAKLSVLTTSGPGSRGSGERMEDAGGAVPACRSTGSKNPREEREPRPQSPASPL